MYLYLPLHTVCVITFRAQNGAMHYSMKSIDFIAAQDSLFTFFNVICQRAQRSMHSWRGTQAARGRTRVPPLAAAQIPSSARRPCLQSVCLHQATLAPPLAVCHACFWC